MPYILVNAFCITGLGGWTIVGAELLLLPCIFGGVVVFVGSLAALIFRPRSHTLRELAAGTFLSLTLLLPAVYMAHELRMWGFLLAGERTTPLVDAIERYVEKNKAVPSALTTLVPNYLPELPNRIPSLKLISGPEVEKNYYGNPWVLFADAGSGILNWDEFIYLPKQNYPSQAYEQLGAWAYYHE